MRVLQSDEAAIYVLSTDILDILRSWATDIEGVEVERVAHLTPVEALVSVARYIRGEADALELLFIETLSED